MISGHLEVPDSYPCAFCDYLSGKRPFTVLHRGSLGAVLITREQRGVAHVLVVPTRHVPTILDLDEDESHEIIDLMRSAAHAIDQVEQPAGISIWQNNGIDADQAIPHLHFHVAGTLPEGGTRRGSVPELSIDETDQIAGRLRSALDLK